MESVLQLEMMDGVPRADMTNPESKEAVLSRGGRPRVSVCMPACRNSSWFKQALRSALAQSLKEIEILITDDSAGDLREVANQFNDPRIHYHPNLKRLGFAGNHSRAIDLANGEYVAILHDDDQWEADYLVKAVTILDANSEIGVVLSGAVEVDGQDQVLGPRPARMDPGVQADPLSSFLTPGFMMMLPSLSVFRRAALKSNRRPWPDVIAADATMFIDVACANWKVHYLAEPLVRYRVHAEQIGTDDLAHRHALVTVWGQYSFAEPHLESLRKKAYARALIARAGAYLKRSQFQRAHQDLLEARRTDTEVVNFRWQLLRFTTLAPFLMPVLLRAKKLLPRRHRHSGF